MTVHEEYLKTIKKFDKSWKVVHENRLPLLKEIMSWLENPDKQLKIIHIAGTNGKGSTGEMLNEVLIAQGYNVGHFSSPAVYTNREQILYNDEQITEADFLKYFQKIYKIIQKHGKKLTDVSYFEWWTLVGLVYFADKKADFVVLEVGLGGQQDATNVISNALLTIFTKISYDHQQILGDSLSKITAIKADIIKKGATVISYNGQLSEVKQILQAKATKVGATWYAGKSPVITTLSSAPTGTKVRINGEYELFLGLAGQYQVLNLNTALQAVDALRTLGYQISQRAIIQGLSVANLPGRMEYDAKHNILRDAAHNPDGISALLAAMHAWKLPFKPTVILGILRDKNYLAMIEDLLPQVDRIIAVTPANPSRALSADELAAQILEMDTNVEVAVADDPTAAITLARQIRESSETMIIITGSFYTLRAVKGIEF
ncbi:bifunctional folylpolyglutamate synthase/dihydrofolate synthase [Periweissella beninensis]|uniref:bifunctional folylpolyglutamate synthase/dihydrofolate synthase n=1 Tax=Periweissella beninensis TaxID=504936 RepID=UPI0021A61949|nr:Mur ligase family protein [Periweissella beninensis]MCT4396993.1 hypothetical protein [Periweissella beninensis]